MSRRRWWWCSGSISVCSDNYVTATRSEGYINVITSIVPPFKYKSCPLTELSPDMLLNLDIRCLETTAFRTGFPQMQTSALALTRRWQMESATVRKEGTRNIEFMHCLLSISARRLIPYCLVNSSLCCFPLSAAFVFVNISREPSPGILDKRTRKKK